MLTDWPPCATTTTPLTEVTTHHTLGRAGEERADGRIGDRAARRPRDRSGVRVRRRRRRGHRSGPGHADRYRPARFARRGGRRGSGGDGGVRGPAQPRQRPGRTAPAGARRGHDRAGARGGGQPGGGRVPGGGSRGAADQLRLRRVVGTGPDDRGRRVRAGRHAGPDPGPPRTPRLAAPGHARTAHRAALPPRRRPGRRGARHRPAAWLRAGRRPGGVHAGSPSWPRRPACRPSRTPGT